MKNPELLRNSCLINGEWLAATGASIEVRNPANGELVGSVPSFGAAETRRAIDAAQAAFHPWRAKTAAERARILKRWFELMMENQEDLARLMTLEQGKPLAEARGEIAYAASFIEWFAEEARRVYGEVIPSPLTDRRLIVLKQPIGVCAAITPWNFPAAMITRKAAPALAAGCTMVVKPAEQTPLSALALAYLAQAIGGELTSNPKVLKLSFTGSTEVGRLLMGQCAPTIKKLSLELGGNAPFIVFDDADIDAAVAGAMLSKYRNTGQTCVCTNRFLVQEGVHDAFAQKLAAAVAGLKVGSGLEDGVTQGPLIDGAGLAKVEELLADAVAQGARVLCGGKRHTKGGTFFEPTVLSGATPSMRLAREEIFGPVAPIFSFKDEAEAVRMANDTEFGLAAYFYSRDIARAWRVGEALDCGMVGINSGMISNEVAPFGGVKQSGLGREGSKYGIEEYLEIKYLAMAGL
ncbi:MAG: NAD-dependent succinate-semialdehyde dehydrogenase [Sulfuritalea sp.]|nr:NAD-dependent succinate-semialdehyde dehydrogenase [Sulfuritalea sp.]